MISLLVGVARPGLASFLQVRCGMVSSISLRCGDVHFTDSEISSIHEGWFGRLGWGTRPSRTRPVSAACEGLVQIVNEFLECKHVRYSDVLDTTIKGCSR